MMKRIISVFLVFVILFLMVPFASADYINTPTGFWDSLLHRAIRSSSILGADGVVSSFCGQIFGSVCATSPDGYHHASTLQGCSTGTDDHGLYANATCQYCGDTFKAYSSDLKTAYDKSVEALPSNGYSSDGSLLYRPPVLYIYGQDYYDKYHCSICSWGDMSSVDTSGVTAADATLDVSASEVPRGFWLYDRRCHGPAPGGGHLVRRDVYLAGGLYLHRCGWHCLLFFGGCFWWRLRPWRPWTWPIWPRSRFRARPRS